MKKYYKIDIFVSSQYHDDLFEILEQVKEYDMIHFFWRKLLLQFESDEFKQHLIENHLDFQEYVDSFKNKISTGIYDHLFVDHDNIKIYEPIFTKYSKMYYTCSEKLRKVYEGIKEYPNPWGVIHDTYDNHLYNDKVKHIFHEQKSDPLVIGWVGNSNWNLKYKDFKGFHTILNPVLDELTQEGYLIERHFADKNIRFRTNEEMPGYYQEIDVCIIVSMEEGTPRPVIEAMASGVPIISTDVGIVSESFGPKQMKFVIGSRNDSNDEEIKTKLKNKIIELYENREILKELSLENYQYSHKNSIDELGQYYQKYFDDFLVKN